MISINLIMIILIDGLVNLVKANHSSGASEIMVASSPTIHWKKDSNESIEEFIYKVEFNKASTIQNITWLCTSNGNSKNES